jgi:hypothetical protein
LTRTPLEPGWQPINTALFNSIDFNSNYWSATEYAPLAGFAAWSFRFYDGYQDYTNMPVNLAAWPVHSGDVGTAPTVPEPSSVWLVGSGLAGLLGLSRKCLR